jgi:hypothetical protein
MFFPRFARPPMHRRSTSWNTKGRDPGGSRPACLKKSCVQAPLPSAGITQIRFIGSAARPVRLPLSQMAPLAAINMLILQVNAHSSMHIV